MPAEQNCHFPHHRRRAAATIAKLPPPPPLCCHLHRAATAVTATAVAFVFVVVVVSNCYSNKRVFSPFLFFNCCLSSCNCCCFHHQRPLLSILSGWLPRCLSSRQCLPSTSAPLPLITPPHLIVLLVCLLFDWLPRCLSKEEYKKQQSNGHVGKMAAGN